MFCRKCGTEIEDDSAFCRRCGTAQGDQEPPPVLVEMTPKTHKVWMLVGGLVCLAGLGIATLGVSDVRSMDQTQMRVGMLLGAVGLGVFLAAKILAWWRTG